MALKLAFQQWGRCVKHQALDLQSTVGQILLDRSQERAEELMDLLLATKSLRVYLSAWLRFARSRKARRRALRRALRIRIRQLEHSAWMQWTSVNHCHKKLRQIYSVVEKMVLRTAWQTLRRNHRLHSQQARATHTISKILRRSWLRFEWSSWKRRDRLVVYEQVKVSQQNSLKLVRAVMEGLAHRHHVRSSQNHCFLRWRQQVAKKKRIRQFWSHLTGNREHLSIKASFQGWTRFTNLSIERRTLLKRVFTRQLKTAIWCVFHHWKYEGIIAIHRLQLASAQQEFHNHRAENAKRVAMVMYMAWKRPCLSSCFSNWRMCIQDQKREFEARVTQQNSKRTTGTMSKVLSSWRGFARMKRAVGVLWKTFVSENGRKRISNCFLKWKSDFVSKQKLVFTFSHLVETLRLWHLHQGFKRLQVSHQAIQRRESMMIVLSAQNALKQQKRQHLMKSVAFLVHKRQNKSLRELFAHWRSTHEAKKQLNVFFNATRRRFQLKMMRRVLSKWWIVVKRRRSTAKMVLKLQNAWSKRKLRKRWTDWCAFMEYSHRTKWLVYNRMFENRVHLEVQSAWGKWRSVVKQANLEIEQARVTSWTQASERQLCEIETLENRNESLLLESVGLRMQINELRKRNLILFCFKLVAVVATSAAGSRHKVARAFAKWGHRAQSVSVLVGLLTELRTQWAASGFHKWRSITTELRISAELEKKETYAMEKVLLVFNCSNAQQRKRKVLLLWRAMTDRQRAKKKNAMLLLLAKRSSDRVVLRCCWASWKTLLMRKRDTQTKVCAMQTRAKQRLVQQIYLRWCRWHMTARDIRNGLLLLARVVRGSQRKQVAHCWLRWRSQRMDAVVTITHAKLAILELEHWNAACQHNLDQLMALVFANWKRFVRVAQARRWGRVVAYRELQSRQLVRKCFGGWRNQLPARRCVLHPVLCIQTSLRKAPKVATSSAAKSVALAHQHERRLFYCSYNEYRRNLQCSWRLKRTKSALRKRVLRICALSILLQRVRRQHLAAQKRALWIWFAKCQCISPALGSIQFKSVPWRIPRTNFAGSMLLLALEEMHHLQQAFSVEQRAQSLKTLAVIAKGFRRQHLQRAFDRLKVQRVAFAPLAKRYKRERAVMTVAHLHKAERAAAAQAFAGKLVCFLVRRSFRVWKEQYIEAALVQAEAAQMELLHALRDVSSYRQTLDPYAVPY